MLFKAILITIVTWLLHVEYQNGHFGFNRPIVAAPIIGLLLGDLKTGVMIGGTLQLIFMGATSIGGAVPPDAIVGTVIATSFAILTNQSVELALSLALPAAIASQATIILNRTVNTGLMHMADRAAEEGNYRKIEWAHYLGALTALIRVAVVVFPAIYFGVDAVEKVIAVIPAFVLRGLEVAGGMLPAVGFGMLLTMLDVKELRLFFFLGFAFATFGGYSLIGVAVVGVCIALLYDHFTKAKSTESDLDELKIG